MTLSDVEGVVLDLDGTVWADDRLISGAATAVETLRSAGLGVCFATNTTRRPRSDLVRHLNQLGIEAAPDDLLTAPAAAATWLREQGLDSVALYLADATYVEFDGFSIDDRMPAAIVVGDLGDSWTYERLNQAFRQLAAGARLVAVQRNRYWRTAEGLMLDAGPFVAALEYASGREAVTVGKPSAAFFETAARSLDLPLSSLVMVGDDIVSDVGGAIAAGLRGVLVRTGKFRSDDRERGVNPDAVIDSVADLPALLRVGARSSGL